MFVAVLPFVLQYGSELGKPHLASSVGKVTFFWRCLLFVSHWFWVSSFLIVRLYRQEKRITFMLHYLGERRRLRAPRLVRAFACVRARFPPPNVAKTQINALCKPRRRMSSCLSAFARGRTHTQTHKRALRSPSGPSVQRAALKVYSKMASPPSCPPPLSPTRSLSVEPSAKW